MSLVACGQEVSSAWSGYTEGDFVYVAATLPGRIDAIHVTAGQQVAQGDPLFTLESEFEGAAQAEAAARLKIAQAQASNLTKGRRNEEIAMTEAQLAQAQASVVLARQDMQRQQQLLTQGFVSRARVDDASTQLQLTLARVDELKAALQVAHLPARNDERTAALANAMAAEQTLRQNDWRAAQKKPVASQAALVSDVLFQAGEYVQAGQPVVVLLPPGNVKARFFVPEAELSSVRLGQSVQLTCDGCQAPISAVVTRIATQPEFTPPVIYSNTQRARLVFSVEARPSDTAGVASTLLKPGQPLEVRIRAVVVTSSGKP
jgi:HlyD family secretion protein